MKDQITSFVIGVAFVTIVFFAGMAKGQSSVTRQTNDPLANPASIMTLSECIGLMGKIGGSK